VARRAAAGEHRVAGDVLDLGGEQLLELVQQQRDDARLGRLEPGDQLVTAATEGLHESRW
jgi:hypothetical protein